MEGYYKDNTAYAAIKEVDGVKKDCFAYSIKSGHEECIGLKKMYCRCEECVFYKSKEEYAAQVMELYGAENAAAYLKKFYNKSCYSYYFED